MLRSLAASAAVTASKGDLVAAHQLLDDLDELADRTQDEWLAVESRAVRADVLARAMRVDESVAVALEVADSFVELGAARRARATTLWVARTLVAAHRLDDAVAVYSSLLDEGRALAELFGPVTRELADALESLGRRRAAARVRAALEA